VGAGVCSGKLAVWDRSMAEHGSRRTGAEAGANAGYSEGDSAQQEARARLEAGESDPAGATATARR
jgi:hypothetical protein